MHTLHCARNVVKCIECDATVGKEGLAAHNQEAHTLRVCEQCLISVEAYKLPEHKVCEKLHRLLGRPLNIFTKHFPKRESKWITPVNRMRQPQGHILYHQMLYPTCSILMIY